MNPTQIEWVKNPDGSQGYTHNSISGCKNHTPEGLCLGGLFPCYAWKLAHTRLKQRYLANPRYDPNTGGFNDPFYPRFWEKKLDQPFIRQKPSGIFVCDMSDLFGLGVPDDWTIRVLDVIRQCPQHRFYLLTKQPQRLPEFSPFPDNAWVGVTATNTDMLLNAINCLEEVKAQVKYISLEPLLSWADTSKWVYPLSDSLKGLSWLILGACTGTWRDMVALSAKYPELAVIKWAKKWIALPRIEWLREIVQAADKAGIKVFLKNNLRPLLIPEDCSKPNYLTEDIFWASEKAQLRQEMPDIEEAINAQP